MKLFLTGATGTIGPHLLEKLLAAGHEVVHAGRRRLPLEHPKLRWLTADFTALDSFDFSALDGCDAVLHMANLTKESPLLDESVATRLFREAGRRGVANFFFASSIRVYGHRLGVITEASAPSPLRSDAYGRRKLATERALRGLAGGGTGLRVLRIGQVITPENESKLAGTLRPRTLFVWGRGFPHWISVADVVDAVVFLAGKGLGPDDPAVFNVTRDELRLRELAGAGEGPSLPLAVAFVAGLGFPAARETRCARIRAAALERLGYRFPGRAFRQISS